jgi:excinuclease ABC subunit C
LCYFCAVTQEKFKTIAKTLPAAPGVYFFLGARKKILYIGKATSLKNRVRSYFAPDLIDKRSKLIENMVAEAVSIEFTVTDSVLEALILETNLIRSHKPHHNTRSKDDKSYNHLVITNEEWPRVLVVRGKDLTERFAAEEIQYHFGPFPSGKLFQEALKIVRKLFKFYDTKVPVGSEKSKFAKGKIDFNRQIGLYPGAQSPAEYKETIRHIKLFFQGKKKQIIKELERSMKEKAKLHLFEEAGVIKNKIYALTHIQDVALIKNDSEKFMSDSTVRIEAYDIAHLQGSDMVGVMTVVENGEAKKSEYRKFKITSVKDANDPAALKEVLTRRFGHPEWTFPSIVAVDGSTAQINAAELVLSQLGLFIPVVAVVKDEHHRARDVLGNKALVSKNKLEILFANAEAHRFAITYHRQKRGKAFTA